MSSENEIFDWTVKFKALYPLQNPNLCLQYCRFELLLIFTFQYSNSTIQHCPFTIQCPYFKCNVVQTYNILIQCSMCWNGVRCDMLATESNIIVFYIPNQYPYFTFKFIRLTCSICVFQCNVNIDTWSVCILLQCRVQYACCTIQHILLLSMCT